MSIIRKFIFQTDEEDTCGSLTLDSDVRFCVWRAVTTYKDRVNIQEFRHLGQENPRRKNTLSLSFYDKWNNECMWKSPLLVLLFCFLSFIARLLLIYNKTLFEINELLVAWNWKRDFWRADRKLQGCFFFNLDAISSLSHSLLLGRCFRFSFIVVFQIYNTVGTKKGFCINRENNIYTTYR